MSQEEPAEEPPTAAQTQSTLSPSEFISLFPHLNQLRSSRGVAHGEMEEEDLIREVENYSILYDPANPFYKDSNKKDKTWREVARNLGVDADQCRNRWRCLRDAFVKSKKRPYRGVSREWRYEKIMNFLLPYIHVRRSQRNKLSQIDSERAPLSPSTLEEPPGPASPGSGPAPSSLPGAPAPPGAPGSRGYRPSRSRSPPRRTGPYVSYRDRRPPGPPPEVRERSPLQDPGQKPYIPEDDLDESYHFALSIVPMLHRLDRNKRLQAKLDILNTLYTLESSQHQRLAPTPP